MVPNLNKADWSTFRYHTEVNFFTPDMITKEWMDAEASSIISTIKFGLKKACPLMPEVSNPKKSNYWSEDLQSLKAKARTLFKRFKRDNLQATWDAHIQAKRLFKKELTKAKHKAWQSFTEKTKEPKDLAKLFKCVQKRENNYLGLLTGTDNTPEGALKLLMETHFPNSQILSLIHI